MFPRSVVAAAYAALAGLVAAGSLSGIDQWAVEHLMPGADFRHERTGLAEAVVPLFDAHWGSGLAIAANIVTLPAAVALSFALVVALSRVLAVALVAADLVELICKETLARPALYDGALHIRAFDSSFPSGHALRALLVAGAVAQRWPRALPWVAAWAAASVALLQLAGWHTPSDLAGGVLLAVLALLGARAAGALRARRLRAGARA